SDGLLLAIYDHDSLQLVSSQTGLPLTGRFSPKSLIRKTLDPRARVLDIVEVGANGEIHARCPQEEAACEGQVFVRDPPDARSIADCPLELLTGRDRAGNRVEPDALIALPGNRCHSAR